MARSPRVSSTSPLWNPRVERGVWIAIFTRLTNTSRPQRPSSCCISTRNASWSYTIASKYNVRLSREDRKSPHLGGLLCVGFWIHHSFLLFLLLLLCIFVERECVMVIGLSKRIPQTVGVFLFIFIGRFYWEYRLKLRTPNRDLIEHLCIRYIFWDLIEGRDDYPVLNWIKVDVEVRKESVQQIFRLFLGRK